MRTTGMLRAAHAYWRLTASAFSLPWRSAIEPSGISWGVCTKNEEGRKAVSRMAEVLFKIREKRSYRELYEKWISENDLKSYRANYQEQFLKIYEE